MPDLLPVLQAARALGVTERQLRRWMADGCPQARRGARGRGRAALLDLEAVAAWRRQASAEDALRVFAARLPELVAGLVYECFLQTEGPHRRAMAGALAASWYAITTGLQDELRHVVPDLPEPALPEKIARLRHIYERFGTVATTSSAPEPEE